VKKGMGGGGVEEEEEEEAREIEREGKDEGIEEMGRKG
jgi:hypothetical protein